MMSTLLSFAFIAVLVWAFRQALGMREEQEGRRQSDIDDGLDADDDVEVMYDEEAWLTDHDRWD